MPDALVVVLPLTLAAVLMASGLSKIGDPDPLHVWQEIDVPEALRRPILARAHPWVEVLLALAMVFTAGLLHTVTITGVLLLMVGYTTLIGRVLRRQRVVSCNCFGAHGALVTRRTWWRDVWLSAIALTALITSMVDSRWPLSVLSTVDARWWAVATTIAAVTTAFVTSPGDPETEMSFGTNDPAFVEGDELDYVRARTPAIPLTLGDGSPSNLQDLARERATLVFEVSESCGGCREVIRSIPDWRSAFPGIDVRVLTTSPPEGTTLTSVEEPRSLHDPGFFVSRSLGYVATPSAFLLGADGMLAGGPVTGDSAIREFVADIRTELQMSVGDESGVHAHEAG